MTSIDTELQYSEDKKSGEIFSQHVVIIPKDIWHNGPGMYAEVLI